MTKDASTLQHKCLSDAQTVSESPSKPVWQFLWLSKPKSDIQARCSIVENVGKQVWISLNLFLSFFTQLFLALFMCTT